MYETIQKTIIAWAFNHYIAYYYFDNINVNQLKIAFEKGEIELENLPIKKDALKHLKIPWNVVSGVVGKLSIRIPLSTPLTDPWLIRLENPMLIVSKDVDSSKDANPPDYSFTEDDLDPEEFNINSEETKLAEFYKSFSATVTSIVADIFKNIKLEIESLTLIFEGFEYGLVKISVDSLLLHRPDDVRNLLMNNVMIYFSHTWPKRDDLLRVNLKACDLKLSDISNNGHHFSLEINSETEINGSLYLVGSSSVPLCEFLLEDLRLLYFSGGQQQDGSIFAKVSCRHFNREKSSWGVLLQPWPINLSWDKRVQHRKFSLTSDEQAEFFISSSLLDLIDVVMRRIRTETKHPRLWSATKDPISTSIEATQESNAILVLKNESGYRIFFAPVLSTSNRFSGDNNLSTPDHQQSSKWASIKNGETTPLEPIESILIRVEGWKTLPPIRLDKTGIFYREACSDRVKNEDTCFVISIDLEDKSARKIISIKSPLTVVNELDAALEVQSYNNQAWDTSRCWDLWSLATKTPFGLLRRGDSPQDCKLFYYNYSTNLASHIGARSARKLFHTLKMSELSFVSSGLKVTLLDSMDEKIVEILVENMVVKSTTKAKEQIIDCSLQDIRIENALPDCEKCIVLDRASASDRNPAIHLIMDRILGKSLGTVWFRQVQLSMCELVINIEERLFLKLIEFIRRRRYDSDRRLHPEEVRSTRYYFDLMRIDLSFLKLSVFTSANLPNSLQKLKTCLGLNFFSFEDASVQLAPYFKMNVSLTLRGILDSVTRFYKKQISEQAPRIVGQQIQNYLRFRLSDMLSLLYDEIYNNLLYF